VLCVAVGRGRRADVAAVGRGKLKNGGPVYGCGRSFVKKGLATRVFSLGQGDYRQKAIRILKNRPAGHSTHPKPCCQLTHRKLVKYPG
jgi:hypothetical protein